MGWTPRLVQLADEQTRESWLAVDAAIRESEQHAREEGASSEQVAQLYLARARLWARMQNHHDAVSDMAQAAAIFNAQASAGEQDILDLAIQYDTLSEELQRYRNSPARPFVAEAHEYWVAGILAARRGECESALQHFTDASQLNPQRAIYWYGRAALLRRLGNDSAAERAVRLGVAAEVEFASLYRVSEFYGALSSFADGKTRFWIESFRRGEAAAWDRDNL